MAKFLLRGLTPGKKYKMIIEADNNYFTADSFPAIDFIVPQAPVRANTKSLDVSDVVNKTTLERTVTIKIPEDVTSNLIWNESVRDVVYILYRTAANKNKALSAERKYIRTQTVFDFLTVPDIPNWTMGQPRVTTWKLPNKEYYSFQFIIARYIKDENGAWATKFWLQGNKLNNVLSKQASWWNK